MGAPHSTLQTRPLATMPPQASDSDEDLGREHSLVGSEYILALPLSLHFTNLRTSILGLGVKDVGLEEDSDETSNVMDAPDTSPAKALGNRVTEAKGGAALFASTGRVGRRTRGVNGEKHTATMVSLADVENDGQESGNESSSDESEPPAISKFMPSIKSGARRGRATRNSGSGTNGKVDSARPTPVAKKRGRKPKMPKADPKSEDEGLSEQPAAKRRGRSVATPSAMKSGLASRRGGRQSASRGLVAANETGQRRSVRAATAAAEAQAKAAIEDKVNPCLFTELTRVHGLISNTQAKKSRATTAATKPTRGRSRKPAANKRGEYNVEAITDHRLDKNASPEYFVKWEGYPISQNTWEPKSNLTQCKAALNDYLKKASKS